MLVKEFLYGLWLMAKYRLAGGRGVRYPLAYRGRERYVFHRERDRVEATLFNQLKHSSLGMFLERQKKNFVLVVMVDQDWLWVNVHLLEETNEPGPAHLPIYNELRGDDGTFNYIIKNGKLLKSRPCRGLFYVPTAQLLSWRGRIATNEKLYIESLLEADNPAPEIKEI